uniref:Uncharacterized protein n=1 Tax=Arundo donax TaxID=35708 RepID=A0A0A9ANT1_ARUDO
MHSSVDDYHTMKLQQRTVHRGTSKAFKNDRTASRRKTLN